MRLQLFQEDVFHVAMVLLDCKEEVLVVYAYVAAMRMLHYMCVACGQD
jgi:hypothetical protein